SSTARPARASPTRRRADAGARAVVASRPVCYDDASTSHATDQMIPRYSRPEMTRLWAPETRFRIWFEIEAHAADAMAGLGVIPKEAAATIWARGKDATF